MRAAWVAVACAEHVRRGRAGGFMQVCHGKAGPLRRLQPGDGVAYYSPSVALGGKEPCRAFTAIGIVAEGEPYACDMGGGFHPWRRDVRWAASIDAPIAPLLPRLGFSAGMRSWGRPLRFGLLAVSTEDFRLIGVAMCAARPGSAQPHEPVLLAPGRELDGAVPQVGSRD